MENIEKQLSAYSNQDLDGFLECYDDNIIVKMLQTDQTLTIGKNALKETMKAAFANQTNSKSATVKTIAQGNLVFNQEHITGHEDGKLMSFVSIYELNDDRSKITKLWFGGRESQDM